MFLGEYRHNIDAKGRLSIPSKLRSVCGESVYVTRGNDGCLAIYTEDGWQAYYEELLSLPQRNKNARAYMRMITSLTNLCEFDKMGRINIPQRLRQEAQLDKECVIVGSGTHIEIWNQDVWDSYYEDHKDSFDDIYEDIEE